jgi:undecaprenyl-diphosphatase
MLENAVIVAWALIIGGLAILIVEKLARPQECGGVANVSLRQAVGVGLSQCLAMVPGVSRSGATILGAMSLGVDRKTAAEFSFFLAVPTLSGATVLQLARHGDALSSEMMGWIALGSLVSFVVAIVVVKAFISIITRFGFAPFAWYRIVAGGLALVWLSAR